MRIGGLRYRLQGREPIGVRIGTEIALGEPFPSECRGLLQRLHDKRVNQFNPQTLASVQRNAGDVEIWGVEIEVLAQLTDKLQAGLNYGHVDHEYVEYHKIRASGVIIDLSEVSNFPYSPENTARAFLDYEYPLNFGALKARVD